MAPITVRSFPWIGWGVYPSSLTLAIAARISFRAAPCPMTMIMNISPAGYVWILPDRLQYIGFRVFISTREGGILSLCPEFDGEGG